MSYQTSFADLDYNHKKCLTRREVFLDEMAQTVPWLTLIALIEPAYPTTGRRGRQPMPLASMLGIHCLQNWFSFSDRQMEDALYEIESVRRFADFDGVTEALPNETTIFNFRHLLEKHQLTGKLLETINAYLKEQGLLVSQGTMVDATIIHAPSSTKNKDKSRGPDRHQTRKGQQWYFGMKIHIDADVNSGAVHTVTTTAANVADINELPKLLREDDRVIFADAGYTSDEYRRGARHLGIRGAPMTNANPAKTCRLARKSATANSPRFEHGWSMFSGASNNSLAFKRPAIVGWRKMHRRSTCWWVWQIFTCSGGS